MKWDEWDDMSWIEMESPIWWIFATVGNAVHTWCSEIVNIKYFTIKIAIDLNRRIFVDNLWTLHLMVNTCSGIVNILLPSVELRFQEGWPKGVEGNLRGRGGNLRGLTGTWGGQGGPNGVERRPEGVKGFLRGSRGDLMGPRMVKGGIWHDYATLTWNELKVGIPWGWLTE